MVAALESIAIEPMIVPLNSLRVEFGKPPKECKSRREADHHTRIRLPDGRAMSVSDRFWSSFSSLHNIGRSTFDFFSHGEVFDRITAIKGHDVRITCETTPAGGRILSCTNPTKPLLRMGEVRGLVDEHQGKAISYHEGVVTATFECPFPSMFKVGCDDFRSQFNLAMPVDGFGLPAAFLGLLRLICSNGMVAMTPAFKTTFQLGRENTSLLAILQRAMVTFNNEEGFHSLRQRVESSQKSWASLHEARKLHTCLAQASGAEGFDPKRRAGLLESLNKACGDPLKGYGLAGHDELSVRRARSIPIETTVYDLMNFASEASTHHFGSLRSRNRVNAWVGDTLTAEFDLEGTVESFPDYTDYFLTQRREEESPAVAIPALPPGEQAVA